MNQESLRSQLLERVLEWRLRRRRRFRFVHHAKTHAELLVNLERSRRCPEREKETKP